QGVFGAQVHGLDIGIPDVPVQIRGINISQFDLFAAGVAALQVVILAFFFSKTRIGRALRAVADDHQAALAVGIPLEQIWVIVWTVSGFVALAAGILWGSRTGVQFSLTFVALKALPVLILGGFTSIPGAIVGGLLVGASEKLAEVYLGPKIGSGIENWFPYVLATLFLLFRPEGLFGERRIERVEGGIRRDLPRGRPVQGDLRGGPADLPDPPGPDRHCGNPHRGLPSRSPPRQRLLVQRHPDPLADPVAREPRPEHPDRLRGADLARLGRL